MMISIQKYFIAWIDLNLIVIIDNVIEYIAWYVISKSICRRIFTKLSFTKYSIKMNVELNCVVPIFQMMQDSLALKLPTCKSCLLICLFVNLVRKLLTSKSFIPFLISTFNNNKNYIYIYICVCVCVFGQHFFVNTYLIKQYIDVFVYIFLYLSFHVSVSMLWYLGGIGSETFHNYLVS